MTDPTHTPRPAHWLEALLLPHFGWGNVDAVHTLLSTGMATVPEEYPTSPRPLFEALLRGDGRSQCWSFLSYTGINEEWPRSRKGGPLPLTPEDTFPDRPALPGPAGVIPNNANLEDYLKVHEAVFARLLAAGANPWLEVQLPSGPVDGFDLACAWCCTPLIEACLRHPDRPDLETLHGRNPWRAMAPPTWKDEHGSPFFSQDNTLVHAFSANGDVDSLRLLLAHGWKAHPDTSARAPIEVAASEQIVETLLEAGATWKEDYAASWNALAPHHMGLSKTLVARHNRVVREEDPQVAAERMALIAIKGFRERKPQDRDRALDFFMNKAREETETPPHADSDAEALKAWMAMPEVGIYARGEKVAPLFHICRRGIMDQTGNGKLFYYVAYMLARGTQTLPTAKVADECTVQGMAHLFVARSFLRGNNRRTSENLASILAKHQPREADGELVRDILQSVKAVTRGSSSETSKKIPGEVETYLNSGLPFASPDAKLQALTENLDYFKQKGIRNPANFPPQDWLLEQPLHVWVEWGTVLAAGTYHLKTLEQQVDGICERLAQAPQDDLLDQTLRELEGQLLKHSSAGRKESSLAKRVSEARMQGGRPQAPRTTRKPGRF